MFSRAFALAVLIVAVAVRIAVRVRIAVAVYRPYAGCILVAVVIRHYAGV